MIWVGIILCLVVTVIVCLLTAKMKIIIEYRNGETKIVLKSFFLKYTLDDKKFRKFAEKSESSKKKKPRHQKKESKTEEMTAEGFFTRLEKIKETLLTVKDVVVTVCRYLGPRISFSEISVKSTFGTGDAAKTGILVGAVWTLSGNIYSFLCRFFAIDYPEIQLDPIFDQKCFEIEAYGIIKIRPVHIITAVIRGINVYDKHKKEKECSDNGRTTSGSRIDVHSDAEHQRND